jgi:hypothetical protein
VLDVLAVGLLVLVTLLLAVAAGRVAVRLQRSRG